MNKVMLVGNLTADPRVSTIESGKSLCRFSIAINRFSRGEEKKADFIPIVAWEQLAQNCAKYLQKGSKVAVVGSLQINSYTNAQGEKRQSAEVRADSVEFLNRVEGGSYQGSQPDSGKKIDDLEEISSTSDDDMPF